MANVRSGNTYYIDSTGSLALTSVRVHSIDMTTITSGGSIILKDVTTGATKIRIDNTAVNTSIQKTYFTPMFFPNGIDVTTVTNCVATIVFDEGNV